MARYQGDWDCDGTAMLNLAHQFARRTGSVMPFGSRSIALDDDELPQTPFVFLTGHRPFRFTEPERVQLRKYLKGKGYVWVNDSTDIGDNEFDRAVRREFATLFPGAKWRPIPGDHPLFGGPYDLRQGYRGYQVPPGDKYRQDHLEGLWVDGRLAVIYTRNDYGDGLEIDPHTHPLMNSLSDLSPAEMQEGSVRMGINLVSYFMSGGRPVPASAAMAAEQDHARPEWADWPQEPWALLADIPTWQAPEGWEDLLPVEVTRADDALDLRFAAPAGHRLSRRDKVVIEGVRPIDLGPDRLLVLDVHSGLKGGARLALATSGMTPADYLESAPVYLKPGRNQVVFDLRSPTFKNPASEWEYQARMPAGYRAERLYFILYPQQTRGRLRLGELRVVRPR